LVSMTYVWSALKGEHNTEIRSPVALPAFIYGYMMYCSVLQLVH
jgi:hypothetical protein